MDKSVHKDILRLAIPNILSNVSVPLMSAVDTALMGRLSVEHLGAVGLGSMIFNFIYWNFGFLRMGTTGITAQEFGRNNRAELQLILMRSLGIALFISLVLMLLYIPLSKASIYLLNVSETQQPFVSEYFSIRILAAPATIILYVLMGWLFGMQNAVFPLIITVLSNIANLVLSYVFVIQWGWNISGVAWGTVIAQYIGVSVGFILLWWKYPFVFNNKWKNIKGHTDDWMKIFNVNSYLFIRTVLLTLAFALFYSHSSAHGAIILAANVVLLQFSNWISYGIDGFAFASESLVGRFYGAKNKVKLQKAIRYSFIWGLVLSAFYSLLYYRFDTEIIRIFSDDETVINTAKDLKTWMLLLPFMAFGCYIWDGIYIGLTQVKMMMYSMVISFVIYLLLLNVYPYLNFGSIWIVLILFLFVRGIIQSFLWFRIIKPNIIQLIDQ